MTGRRAVFLDRDGTLNLMFVDPTTGVVDSPMTVEQFELVPGVACAVRVLNDHGFLVVVVSNQPAVAKRKTTLAAVEAVTDRLRADLAREGARVDAVYYCLHHPGAVVAEYRERCSCRKPAPGLLLRAADELGIDLAGSFMIGDGDVDVLAGKSAGCVSIRLGPGKAEADVECPDLMTAVRQIQMRSGDSG